MSQLPHNLYEVRASFTWLNKAEARVRTNIHLAIVAIDRADAVARMRDAIVPHYRGVVWESDQATHMPTGVLAISSHTE